jgi:hypothetical protein
MRKKLETLTEGKIYDNQVHFSSQFKGRGGWNISCEVYFKGQKKKFNHYTTDSNFIDLISDMRAEDASHEEIQQAYFDRFMEYFNDQIIEWCEKAREITTETI